MPFGIFDPSGPGNPDKRLFSNVWPYVNCAQQAWLRCYDPFLALLRSEGKTQEKNNEQPLKHAAVDDL